MQGLVVSVNISPRTGVKKKPVPEAQARSDHGIVGDAHAASGSIRQVSLLAIESIEKMRQKGLDVHPGDFAENITTQGIDLISLPLGTRISIGNTLEGEVTQIGKECHDRCEIYAQAGDCVMPREGIFIRILKDGVIRKGDSIRPHDKCSGTHDK